MSTSKDIKDLKLIFVVKLQCRATVSQPLIWTMATEFPNSRYKNRHGLVWHLAQLISARGIPVCSHLFTTAPIGDEVNYNKLWNFDLRRESTDAAGNAIFDFDVRSRVLAYNDASYASMNHVPGALEEVGRVMKALDESQVSFSADDSKCGLHVYVGLMKKNKSSLLRPDQDGKWAAEPFKLEELQALSAMVTSAEPCIDAMMAPHRIRAEKCKTPSMTPGLAKMDVLKRIRKIGDTKSVVELVELMNPHKGGDYAFKFCTLRSSKKTRDGDFSRGTIKFRQHESTLDSQETICWLQVVAGMARHSLRADTLSRAKNWVISCDGEEFTFQKFLEKIGKAHLIGFYERKPGRLFAKNQHNPTCGVNAGARKPAVSRNSSTSSVELGTPVDESLNGWVIRDDLSAERRQYEKRQKAQGTTRPRTASSWADSSMTQKTRNGSPSRHGSAYSRSEFLRAETEESSVPRRERSSRSNGHYSRSGSSTDLNDEDKSRRDTIVSIINKYTQSHE